MASASDAELTPEQIERNILPKVKTVSLIQDRSACSVIFDCTLTNDTHVCMKVSFVSKPSAELLSFTYTPNSSKITTTEAETEKTQERQHGMHNELKAYNLEFIPDAFGSCTLQPNVFQDFFKVKPEQGDHLESNARIHIDLIVQKAKENVLSINVLFMELLRDVGGYKPVHVRHTPYIVAAILAVGIVTGVISQDMHADNVQISINVDGTVNVLKLIDWDRSISIYGPDDLTGWIDSLMDNNVDLFLLVCDSFGDATQQQLETSKSVMKNALKRNFTIYCTDLSQRILFMKSSYNSLTQEQKRYHIFDLLTFIGFMDCLLKGARNMWTTTTMQFSPFLYNLFNTINIEIVKYQYISLPDLLTLRQTYLESLTIRLDYVPSKKQKSNPELERVISVLDEISRILDGFLVPSGSAGSAGSAGSSGRGGRPRYLKRTRHNTIKKQHRNKNNRKSIKRIHRRSKIRKRNIHK